LPERKGRASTDFRSGREQITLTPHSLRSGVSLMPVDYGEKKRMYIQAVAHGFRYAPPVLHATVR
jgi:hypothetical protein